MAFILTTLLLGALSLIVYSFSTWASQQAAARRNNAKLPPQKPTLDPILGFGYKLANFKSFESGTGLTEGQQWHEKLGMTYSESTFLGSALKTAQAENFRAVFGTNATVWSVKPSRCEGFKPFCGEALISTDGPQWEHSRNILKPLFNLTNINDLSFFEGLVRQLLVQIPKDGSSINMEPLVADMSLENACRTVLGDAVGIFGLSSAIRPPFDGKEFAEAWHKSLLGCGMRMFFGRLRLLVPSSLTYESWAKVHGFFEFYIEQSMKARQAGDPWAMRHTVINATLELTNDKNEVRNQALHAMLAAQDTTPVLLCNTFWILARRPDLWRQLRDEVATMSQDSLTIDEARKPRLLRNILSEGMSILGPPIVNKLRSLLTSTVLRMYPVFPLLARDSIADTVLPTGGGPDGADPIFCPAGTNVVTDFWTFNRNPEGVFGKDAAEFKPERWNDLRLEAWHNMAFGNGQRSCLGRRKALGEASCLLIRFAQAFETIESRDSKPYAGVLQLVARNKHGCHVAFRV